MAKKSRRAPASSGARKTTKSRAGSSRSGGKTAARKGSGRPPRKGSGGSAGKPSRGNSRKGTAARTRSSFSSKRPTAGKRSGSDSELVRLQKFLAHAGFGSRRECEELIESGRVLVDGEICQELGSKVNPAKQKVSVDGEKVTPERLEYYVLNKPPGVLSTSRDPSGRPRVIDLIQTKRRVYNVGRLDKSSEGLILVTNDGELAHRLTHPRYGVPKTYHVQVEGEPDRATLKKLLEGIYLADGFAKMANVRFKRRQKNTAWLEIVLEEGRNREIRRLLAKVGHKVLKLRRIAIGPLRLGDLPLGAHRQLEQGELRALRFAIADARKAKPARKKPTANRSTSRKSAASDYRDERRSSERGGKSASTRSGSRTERTGKGSGKGKTTSRQGPPKRSGKPSGRSGPGDTRQGSASSRSGTGKGRKPSARKSTARQSTERKSSGRKPGGRKPGRPQR